MLAHVCITHTLTKANKIQPNEQLDGMLRTTRINCATTRTYTHSDTDTRTQARPQHTQHTYVQYIIHYDSYVHVLNPAVIDIRKY